MGNVIKDISINSSIFVLNANASNVYGLGNSAANAHIVNTSLIIQTNSTTNTFGLFITVLDVTLSSVNHSITLSASNYASGCVQTSSGKITINNTKITVTIPAAGLYTSGLANTTNGLVYCNNSNFSTSITSTLSTTQISGLILATTAEVNISSCVI